MVSPGRGTCWSAPEPSLKAARHWKKCAETSNLSAVRENALFVYQSGPELGKCEGKPLQKGENRKNEIHSRWIQNPGRIPLAKGKTVQHAKQTKTCSLSSFLRRQLWMAYGFLDTSHMVFNGSPTRWITIPTLTTQRLPMFFGPSNSQVLRTPNTNSRRGRVFQ